MNNTLRYLLAGILIFLIILLQPLYLDWLGYDLDGGAEVQGVDGDEAHALSGHPEKKKSDIAGGQKGDYFDLVCSPKPPKLDSGLILSCFCLPP